MWYSSFTYGQMAVVHREATFCMTVYFSDVKLPRGIFPWNSYIRKKELAKEFLMTVSEVSSMCNKNKAKEAQPNHEKEKCTITTLIIASAHRSCVKLVFRGYVL